LPGISFSFASWQNKLVRPHAKDLGIDKKDEKKIVVVCYKLEYGNSATQPFILEPVWMDNNLRPECQNLSPSNPLLMDDFLVLAIDMTDIAPETRQRFKLLNINITNQQGASLNPTPIRPSLTAGTASGGEQAPQIGSTIYYLTWPNELPGDTIPTVSVNVIYTPVAPGLIWKANTFYPAGSVVISDENGLTNGHYYMALKSGTSACSPHADANPCTTEPAFNGAAVPVQVFRDGKGVYWKDRGTSPPATGVTAWQPSHDYAKGTLVSFVQMPGHYYEAQTSGKSSTINPDLSQNPSLFYDGDLSGLTWQEHGLIAVSPAPATWQAGTSYAAGASVVPPGSGNGHYYSTERGGTSAKTAPAFPVRGGGTVKEATGLVWTEQGAPTLSPLPPAWQPNTAYSKDALVVPTPANGHYYKSTSDGVSGPNAPPFPVAAASSVTESTNLEWIDEGASATPPTTIKSLKAWAPSTAFFAQDGVLDPQSGHYYAAVQSGISGLDAPPFYVPAPQSVLDGPGSSGQIQWQDLGTSLPASVSSVGTTPNDQTVNLLTYTYPQVHALSRFNLASGVLVSSIKSPNIVNTGTTASPQYVAKPGTILVDPVLAVTVYFKAMDAERKWQRSDLTPGGTIGFSLTSPTTNFYLGASSELFYRNLQLVYGYSAAKVTALGPASANGGPVISTEQKFRQGGFVGLSFNITGFIQSLF
jgi:hypothetical protein